MKYIYIIILINILNINNISYSTINTKTKKTLNWSKGFYKVKVSSKDLGYSKKQLKKYYYTVTGRELISQKLLNKAQEVLFNAILNTRINSLYFVKDYFNIDKEFKNIFVEYIKTNMIIFPTLYTKANEIEKIVQYQLYGPKSLAALLFKFSKNFNEKTKKLDLNNENNKKYFSSVIIDLRYSFKTKNIIKEKVLLPLKGLKIPNNLKNKFNYKKSTRQLSFKGYMSVKEKGKLMSLSPSNHDYIERIKNMFIKSQKSKKELKFSHCIFPKILDEHGNIIYSQNIIGLKNKYDFKYVTYIKNPIKMYNIELVGSNPLIIPVLELKSDQEPTSIVISHEDANNFHKSKKNIFLLF